MLSETMNWKAGGFDNRPPLAGVLGWPVAHSLSPMIHGHWFATNGVDGAYVRLPVRPEDLALVVPTLARLGFHGVNVTIPHKQAMFHLVDEVDEAARRMGAVNTVLVGDGGRLLGLNTDGVGFIRALYEAVPDCDIRSGPVVLVGTGGACRAIAVSLLDRGAASIRLVNRTRFRAEALRDDLRAWSDCSVDVCDWNDRHQALDSASLLVNCSSLGMKGQPILDLHLDSLPHSSPVFDIVYNPLETQLLSAARRRGHPTIDGLGMLLHQAVPGFCHWGGVEPLVDQALRKIVLSSLDL